MKNAALIAPDGMSDVRCKVLQTAAWNMQRGLLS